MYVDGSPLTRSGLITAVRAALTCAGLDVSRFTGHSFWTGPATAAAHEGLPDLLIQMLGRWRSSSFLRYIHTLNHTLLSVSRTLVRNELVSGSSLNT